MEGGERMEEAVSCVGEWVGWVQVVGMWREGWSLHFGRFGEPQVEQLAMR